MSNIVWYITKLEAYMDERFQVDVLCKDFKLYPSKELAEAALIKYCQGEAGRINDQINQLTQQRIKTAKKVWHLLKGHQVKGLRLKTHENDRFGYPKDRISIIGDIPGYNFWSERCGNEYIFRNRDMLEEKTIEFLSPWYKAERYKSWDDMRRKFRLSIGSAELCMEGGDN